MPYAFPDLGSPKPGSPKPGEIGVPATLNRRLRFIRNWRYYTSFFLRLAGRIRTTDLIRRWFPWSLPDAGAPPALSLELTSACQLRCVYCPNISNTRQRGFMSEATFDRVLRQIRECDIREVRLVGCGEPTLHPAFAELVSRLARCTRVVTLTTNGQSLSDAAAEAILKHIAVMNVSVDSFFKAGYESIRVGRPFESLLENLTRFRELRRAKHGQTLVNIQCMLRPSDAGREPAMEAFWKQYGDVVSWLHVLDFSTSLDTHARSSSHARYPRCAVPFKVLQVHWDGIVPLCSYSTYQTGAPDGLVVGNIYESTIHEIWNGGLLKQYRNGHRFRNTEWTPICKGCNGA
jgi:MoaA/NifB/PqqE/SkfB family radical SAM enzyme